MPTISAAQTIAAFPQTASAGVRAGISAAQTGPAFPQAASAAVLLRIAASQANPAEALAATLVIAARLSANEALGALAVTALLSVTGEPTAGPAPGPGPAGYYFGIYADEDAEADADLGTGYAFTLDGGSMLLRQLVAPVAEPIALADAKTHLRVTHAHEDALIAAYLSAAREQVEAATGRALMLQTWELRLRGFAYRRRGIELPFAPLAAVEAIEYVAADGTVTLLDPTLYAIAQPSGPTAPPGSIALAPGVAAWPVTRMYDAAAVRVRYRVGYASAAAVPAALRAATLLLLADLYENREGGISIRGGAPRGVADNPAVERLLRPYRLPRVR